MRGYHISHTPELDPYDLCIQYLHSYLQYALHTLEKVFSVIAQDHIGQPILAFPVLCIGKHLGEGVTDWIIDQSPVLDLHIGVVLH
jgi:hypothetical protein